jgi:hypothetical protein
VPTRAVAWECRSTAALAAGCGALCPSSGGAVQAKHCGLVGLPVFIWVIVVNVLSEQDLTYIQYLDPIYKFAVLSLGSFLL